MSSGRLSRRLVVLALCAFPVACGAQSSSTGRGASALTVAFGDSTPFTSDFNPFSPTSQPPAQGLIYEPLWFFDMADSATSRPWLASSYRWSRGGRTVTFRLRRGVRWSDGRPFTSADVAFTFNLIKRDAALNRSGVPIAGAVTHGPLSVSIDFSSPAYTDINYIAGTTYIVPKHIWRRVKSPATFQDSDPVGTGPYRPESVSTQVMTLTANPRYYAPGLPRIRTIRYLYFSGNAGLDLAVESGEVDWASAYIPNIRRTYESRNAGYHVESIPAATIDIVPNTVTGPAASLAVRRAFSDAIDRSFINRSVYDGLVAPANQTALVEPLFHSITDPRLDKPYPFSVRTAKAILTKAGFVMGADGIFEKNGKALTITIQVPAGYSDYVTVLQAIQQQVRSAGINLVIDAESLSEYSSNRATGNFQMLIEYAGFTSSPYVYYKSLLDSHGIPSVGSLDADGDYGRFDDPAINSLLESIAATPVVAHQRPYFHRIEARVAHLLPVIPISDQQGDTEFNGNVVTGYPTERRPYAEDVLVAPDYAWVTPRLALRK